MSEYDEIDFGDECDMCGELMIHCTCEDDDEPAEGKNEGQK